MPPPWFRSGSLLLLFKAGYLASCRSEGRDCRAEGRCTMLLGMRSLSIGGGANKRGLKCRQRRIWNSEKKHNPTHCTHPSKWRVQENCLVQEGIHGGGGCKSHTVVRWLGLQDGERNSHRPLRPPTAKTVAPSTKSACLPLGLDPVLCPQDGSHASKWRPVRSQEPGTSSVLLSVWNIAACVCVYVHVFGRVVWSIAMPLCPVTTAMSVYVDLDLWPYMHARVCVQVACLLSIR